MQCNTSFVILDPKGEILRDTGKLLETLNTVLCGADILFCGFKSFSSHLVKRISTIVNHLVNTAFQLIGSVFLG